jgi:hypothetical protein
VSSIVHHRTVVIALLSLFATGCSLFTDASDKPSVSLEIQQTDDLGIVAPSAAVADRGVVLRGTVSTPCLGYEVRADAKQRSTTLEVTLRARQSSEGCLTAIGRFPYTATVRGVKSGTKRVIVRQVIEDANWPVETVVDTTLRIP